MRRFKLPPFKPGETYIPVTGKVFDNEEIDNAILENEDF